MNIHFIIHEDFEAPGAYMEWAKEAKQQVSATRLYLGEQLPSSSDDFDMLIVMGGPQSPNTTLADCPYFDAQAEILLISDCIAQDKWVVGVCLGAQLLGEAYGAKTEKSPQQEIGNFPIQLTKEGLEDRCLRAFPEVMAVGHWHGDMPGLTAKAQVLATSEGCPRQIIKYANKHYAFQCHLEFSKELVSSLIAQEENLDEKAASQEFVQGKEELLFYDYSQMNAVLKQFLEELTASG